MSQIPVTEYEKGIMSLNSQKLNEIQDRIRRVELQRTARLKKDRLDRQNRMQKYMPATQRPKSSIFSDRYGSSQPIKV